MALRAYWEQTSRHGVVDRIEIHDSSFGGTEFQLKGDATGFSFSHDIITADSNEAITNPHANRIQVGKLDFRPFIESSEGFTLLEDIRDGDPGQFTIQHKKDTNFWWGGTVTTRIFSYPEKDNNFVGHIRATDFEVLEGKDFTLDDTRQKLITTLADIFGELPHDHDIITRTSWITEDTTDSTDFLDQIYHETLALRQFAKTGDEDPETITYMEALERVADCGLFIRQMAGAIYIEQLTELADPANISETEYDETGTVTSATSVVSRTQTGYTSASSGTPTVKITSQNDSYPALRRARVKFDHRARLLAEFIPSRVTMEDTDLDQQYSEDYTFDGNQEVRFSGRITATKFSDPASASVIMDITVGNYDWSPSANDWVAASSINLDLTKTNTGVYSTTFDITTTEIPSDATGPLTVTMQKVTTPDGTADITTYDNLFFQVTNPTSDDADTGSIDYQLTQQSNVSPNRLDLPNTWFGDGPVIYAPSALRYGTGDTDLTDGSWQRRGTTTGYRNFHENLLKEIMDMQRVNTRKIEADLWGDYDPSLVLQYDSSNWFYAGGTYEGTVGRWKVTLMRLSENTGTDDFEDLPKFTDETGSGTGSTSGGTTGGGIPQSEADARYLQEANNLSDLDSASTARTNLGLGSFAVLDNDGSESVSVNDITVNGTPLFTAGEEQPLGTGDDVEFEKVKARWHVYDTRNLDGSTGESYMPSPNDNIFVQSVVPIFSRDTPSGNWGGILTVGAWLDTGYSRWQMSGTGGPSASDGWYLRSGEDSTWNDWRQIAYNGMTDDFAFGGDLSVSQTLHVDDGFLLLSTDDLTGGHLYSEWRFNDGVDAYNMQVYGEPDLNGNGRALLFRDGGDQWQRIVFGDFDAPAVTIHTANRSLSVSNTLTINGTQLFDIGKEQNLSDDATGVSFGDLTLVSGAVETDNFTSGWQGTGHQKTYAGELEAESMFLRGGLTVNELILNRLHYQDGGLIIGAGGGKVASVSGSAGSETVTFEDPEGNTNLPFSVGAIVMLQDFDLDRTTVVKKIVREVDSITGSDITLTTTTGWTTGNDVGSISAGDEMVAIGHVSNTDRDAFIYMSAVDQNNPFLRVMDGVDAYNKFTLGSQTGLRVQLGNLNGIAGFSTDVFGLYAKDNIVLELDGGNMNIGKDVGGAGVDGIHIDSNDYWYTDGTGSVGNGILNWDASAPIVNMAQFSINNQYMTDGDVFIGNNLSTQFNPGTLLVGNYNDGTTPQIRAVGRTTNNYVYMSAVNDASGLFFRVRSAGNDVVTISEENAKFFGAYADETDLWGGSATKANATVRLDFANGQIYYDAMGDVVYGFESVADFTDDDNAGSAFNTWVSTVTSPAGPTQTTGSFSTKVFRKLEHRFGIEKIVVKGQARVRNPSGGGGTTDAMVNVQYGSVSETQAVGNSSDATGSYEDFTIELDVSGETPDSVVDFEVRLAARVQGASSATTRYADLRNDIVATSRTD